MFCHHVIVLATTTKHTTVN
ncbi:hypothetical protein D049_5200A, partial [Vibrio parahaemolyticus VPTS-2010]